VRDTDLNPFDLGHPQREVHEIAIGIVGAMLSKRVTKCSGSQPSGNHKQFRHPDRPGLVTVPDHSGETIVPVILKSILRQAGLTVDEFRKLLE
jgi:hypothetical protein